MVRNLLTFTLISLLSSNQKNLESININSSEVDICQLAPVNETETESDIFKDYRKGAEIYLSRDIFTGTNITADQLTNAAKRAYECYGVLVPIELALAQAQMESGMGKKGLSPKNNPYNVGEFDNGTKITFTSTQEGIDAYYNLISKNYMNGRSVEKVLYNFVDYRGNRYASDTLYESKIKKQYNFIKRWITKNWKNKSNK
mgnify:CR=1 FL=1